VTNSESSVVDHFFRHEYGRIVSILAKSFGVRSLDLIEDAVQSAMMRALSAWRSKGIPADASAWLYRTAKNIAIDALRRSRFEVHELCDDETSVTADHSPQCVDEAISDETLRLLFLTCHPDVSPELSVALALKLVSGFGTSEIATALLISPSNAEKRIARGKEKLFKIGRELTEVDEKTLQSRVSAVQSTVYLIFSEGFASSAGPSSLRLDLCEEAIRLIRLLIDQCPADVESSSAMLSLMLFHSARFDARLDSNDAIVLLEDQDRSKWDWARIREGMDRMQMSAQGNSLSRYHIEAAIAWEHCRAENAASIDWHQVCHLYQILAHRFPNPMVQLSYAIASGYAHGQIEAIKLLSAITGKERSLLRPWWDCAMGNAYRVLGQSEPSLAHFQDALQLATNQQQRESISKRIELVRKPSESTSPPEP
jgi:RNA polymerase sigma factor (sigma-70 family)